VSSPGLLALTVDLSPRSSACGRRQCGACGRPQQSPPPGRDARGDQVGRRHRTTIRTAPAVSTAPPTRQLPDLISRGFGEAGRAGL